MPPLFLLPSTDEPQEQRNAAIINPVLYGLQLVLCASADMLQAWNEWGPNLVEFFNQAQKGSSSARDRRFSADAA